MTIIVSTIVITILILLSGFFSGSETAMTAASKERLHALAKDGNKKAALVERIIGERKERMIGALLLGNNLVNILASALATSMLIKLFGEAGIVYATLIMTMLVLIFAEVLPKTYALHHADGVAMRIAPILRVVIWVFAPVTELVAWIVRICLRAVGVDISKVAKGSHFELLKGAIEMHDGAREVIEQRAMLRSILDLADVDVEEIMVHRKNVGMIDSNLGIDEIVNIVLDSPYTRLPVYKDEQDNIIGVIHVKQLSRTLHKKKDIELSDILQKPWFIPETTNLFDQLQAFRARKEHFAIVVDEYGAFQGVVTLEDILEEIVGEIDDEHDQVVEGVRSSPEGAYTVDGSVTIRDLNREFEWDLPDEDYATLAGLVLFESQSIPEVGQSFIFHKFRFEILKRQRNQITQLKLTPPTH